MYTLQPEIFSATGSQIIGLVLPEYSGYLTRRVKLYISFFANPLLVIYHQGHTVAIYDMYIRTSFLSQLFWKSFILRQCGEVFINGKIMKSLLLILKHVAKYYRTATVFLSGLLGQYQTSAELLIMVPLFERGWM